MRTEIRFWRVRWTITTDGTDGEEKRFPVMVAPVGAATAAEAVAWVLGVDTRKARALLKNKIVEAEEIR